VATRLITAGLLTLSIAASAAAQPRDHVIDVWDTDRGLPSSSVNSIAQTPEGYLWVATQNGLLRFDGLRFVAFDPDTTPALKHARAEHLFVDSGGTLWINTYDGSITSWRNGVFRHEWQGSGTLRFEAFLAVSRAEETVFVLDRGVAIRRRTDAPGQDWQVLRSSAPNSEFVPIFTQDGESVLWIRGAGDRLWRLRNGAIEEAPTRGLTSTRVQSMALDRQGRIWVGTDREVAVFEDGSFRTMTPTNGEPNLDVSLLLFTRDGDHWVVANGRARKARGRTWVWSDPVADGLMGSFRVSINAIEDRRGGVWFSHYGKGLLHVRVDGSARWITVSDGLPGNRIRHFLEDREGNLWLAIDRGGLARLRDSRFQVLTGGEGRRTPAAASVAEGADGSIWIGSVGGGLQRFRDNVLTNVPLSSGTSGGFVFSVFPSADGRLWMSADREDLFFFDGKQVRSAPQNIHGIKAILTDREGGVWLGTKNGLSRLTGTRVQTFGPADGFDQGDVRALAMDPQGSIWIGSGDGTVYRFRDGRFETFRSPGQESRHPIWAILADADGTIWLGTFRGGLLRLRDGHFTRFTTADGLPSNIVCQVLDDGAGQLWVGSYNGIFRVAKAALRDGVNPLAPAPALPVVSYGRSDGLPTLECSGNYQPSAWRARDGRLWFATPKGVVSIDPREPTLERPPPPVLLEEVRLDQKPIVGPLDSLEIPSGAHRFEFQYTGLSLSTPEQVRFRYRLDGLEENWVEAGTARSAQYSYLPPGNYRFLVAATHGDGRWSPDSVGLAFKVLPHFSETWGFRAAVGVAILGLVAGAARYTSTRRLRRKLERLEWQQALERDRGRIARDIHDDLGAGLTQITLLSELARREPPHEMEAHLGQISDTARELTQTVDEIVWAVNPRQDTLDGLVTYICQFAQEYLTVAGIQCRLDVPRHLPAMHLTADVRHNLFLAVKETLNNIVKHAHAREVWLRLIEDRGKVTLVIEDDGQGFAGAGAASSASAPHATSGQGLGNLENRLSAIGGHCSISSQPGRGTRVELEVAIC
jgi:ligand-binding sensor domain-containing protein/signal transduction histidine kinase